MPEGTKMLVGRHQRLAFMMVGEGPEYTRMTGFTSMSEGKEAQEYSRRYVDESTERTDVTGYATAVEFEFDRYTNDPVQQQIGDMIDDEKTGTDAQVKIVSVDIFDADDSGNAPARLRTYSVIPDTVGDGTDALVYSGSFSAASDMTKGYCTSEDNWQTCTFTEGNMPEAV